MPLPNVSISPSNRPFHLPVWLLIFGFVFLLYGNSITNGYALDDELVTTTDRHEHPLVEKGISGIPAIFKTHYAVNSEQTYEYRPIPIVSFAIEKSLFRGIENQVLFSHVIQLLLYVLLGIVVYKTLTLLLEPYPSSVVLLITLLFLALPIHTEVVNSLKNRDEILSLLFSLFSLNYSIRYVRTQKTLFILWVALFFFLALLSKKTAMPMVVLIPILLYWCYRPSVKFMALVTGGLVLARIGFVMVRKGFLQEPIQRSVEAVENPLINTSWIERIPAFFQSLGFYAKQTLFPVELHSYYGLGGFTLSSYGSLAFILSFLMILLFLGFITYGFFRSQHREASAGMLFFLVAIGGACNLLFPMVGVVGERLAFTASLGLIISFTLLLYHFLAKRFNTQGKPYAFYACMILLGGYYSTMVVNRNPEWKDRITLFRADAMGFESAKAHALLGQECHASVNEEYEQTGKPSSTLNALIIEEREAYEKALSIYPRYAKIESNLGMLYFSYFGENRKALDCFNHAIKINPKNPSPHHLRLTLLQKTYSDWLHFKSEKTRFADTMASYKNQVFIPPFELLTRYENEGITMMGNGLTPDVIANLIRKANETEALNPLLTKTTPGFSTHVKASLEEMYSGKSPSFNMMDRYRFLLFPVVEKALNETIYVALKEGKPYLKLSELDGLKKLVRPNQSK